MSDYEGPSGKSIILGVLGFIVLIVVCTWIFQGNEFFLYKVFAPQQEQVRRETFEESRAFNQGMVQELQNMQFEYVKTKDQNQKDALASIILHRAAGYNLNDPAVSPDLRSFIQQLRRERSEAR